MVQLSTSGRVVTAVAVSTGEVYYAHAGENAWTHASNTSSTTPPLMSVGLNFGAANVGKLWFVDGLNYRQFDPSTGVVTDWTASAGNLPIDSGSNIPRLIETWRSRQVLLSMIGDPYDLFMSAVGDPTNFDYAPAVGPSPADAWSGGTGPQGKIPDILTGFVPFNDDVGFIGCSHSLYLMNGDPQAGGQISLITDRIGMAWGRAWCTDPYGTLYFFSNRCGIYTLAPGSQPQRISQSIEQLVADTNTGDNQVNLAWDDRQQGVHVFITPVVAPATTTHLFFEQRTSAWWTDQFDNDLHNPLCCAQFDGNGPQDRVVLLGSWDGVVRYLDPNAQTDDVRIIRSSVLIGPILTQDLDEMLWKELQGVLGSDSGSVTYSILVGRTAEEAIAAKPFVIATFGPGRNATQYIGAAGHALYLRLDSTVQWRAETFRCLIATKGEIARRAKD